MCDDFPWTMIGGDIPVEVLAKLVEDGGSWESYITDEEAAKLWVNGWNDKYTPNRLAQKLNQGNE